MKVRSLSDPNKIILEELILKELKQFEADSIDNQSLILINSSTHFQDIQNKIVREIEYIRVESDLLDSCGLWNGN